MGCVLLCLVGLLAGHERAENEREVNDPGMGRSCVCVLQKPPVCNTSDAVFSCCWAIVLNLGYLLRIYIHTEVHFVHWRYRRGGYWEA